MRKRKRKWLAILGAAVGAGVVVAISQGAESPPLAPIPTGPKKPSITS